MNSDSDLTGTRAQRRRRQTSARVLQAATSLFSNRGFGNTSMAAIAAQADVSVGTLYNLFDSKDDLYRELVHGKAKQFHARLVAAIGEGGSPRESLDRFLREHISMVVDEMIFIRLYYSINAHARFSLRASLADEAQRLYDDGLQRLAGLLERGQVEGQFELPSTPYRTAVCCQAILHELMMLHANDSEQHPAEIIFDEARRLVYRTVLAADSHHAKVDVSKEQSQ